MAPARRSSARGPRSPQRDHLQGAQGRGGGRTVIRVPRVAPTRINLLAARRRLGLVNRGAALVRRKRDALVRELFRLARPAASVRGEIAAQFAEAYDALVEALATHGRSGVRALAWPSRPVDVQ